MEGNLKIKRFAPTTEIRCYHCEQKNSTRFSVFSGNIKSRIPRASISVHIAEINQEIHLCSSSYKELTEKGILHLIKLKYELAELIV